MFDTFSQLKRHEPLSKHSWYGLGGPADFFAEAKKAEEVAPLIAEAKKNKLPYFILGGGSNTIFHDEGFRGLVIKMVSDKLDFQTVTNQPATHTGIIMADAGASTTQLVKESMDLGLTGLEGLYGLPGTVGGTIFGNAGAHGVEIGTFVENVTLLDRGGEVKVVDKGYMDFSYRHSRLHETGEVVLSVTLKLDIMDENDSHMTALREKAAAALNFRKEKQPVGKNNGSFFKNPKGDFAGRLIEAAGLKGYKIGGA